MNQDLQVQSLKHENEILRSKLVTAEEELTSLRVICKIPNDIALHSTALTTREREVFNLLVSREWVSHCSMEAVIWQDGRLPDQTSYVIRATIMTLRRKVCKIWLIENVRGAGYKMTRKPNK